MSVSTPSAMGSACRIACQRPRGKEETAGAGLGGGAGNCNRGREAVMHLMSGKRDKKMIPSPVVQLSWPCGAVELVCLDELDLGLVGRFDKPETRDGWALGWQGSSRPLTDGPRRRRAAKLLPTLFAHRLEQRRRQRDRLLGPCHPRVSRRVGWRRRRCHGGCVRCEAGADGRPKVGRGPELERLR